MDQSIHPIGIVVPSYKEGANIAALLLELSQRIPGSQLVLVDDSPDEQTVSAAKALGLSQLKIIHRTKKDGRGSAVLDGIRYLLQTNCEYFLEMDADFSHPPGQILELISEGKRQKLDLLIASRYLRESKILNWPLSRRIFSKFSNFLARRVLKVPVSDYTNGFRLYSAPAARHVVEHCGKHGKGFIALSEILVSLHCHGFRVGETSTVFTNRIRGESSLNFSELKNAAIGLLQIYLLKQRIIKNEAVCITGKK